MKLLKINGTLINSDSIVTAHVEDGTPAGGLHGVSPIHPDARVPQTLVVKTIGAGELRFTGQDAAELWASLDGMAEQPEPNPSQPDNPKRAAIGAGRTAS